MNQRSGYLEGHCLCGQVTIRVDGLHDPSPGACHCRMCQRWTGGLFLCFFAEESAVSVAGQVTRFASSAFAERAFCPACGTHLWMRDVTEDNPGYDLMPGLFDAAQAWPMRSEIYSDMAMHAIRLAGDHPRLTRAEYEAKNPHIEGD